MIWAGPGGGPANFGRYWGDYAFHWHGRRTREAAVCICRLCTPTHEYWVVKRGWGFRLLTGFFGGGELPRSTAGDIGGNMGSAGMVGVLGNLPCL